MIKNLKEDDLLIKKTDGGFTLKVKQITEKSVIVTDLNNKEYPISVELAARDYVLFLKPANLVKVPLTELKREDLSVGMELVPIYMDRESEEIRKVTVLREHYYLYVDSTPGGKNRQETRGDYGQLARLKILDTTVKPDKKNLDDMKKSIGEYNNSKENLKKQLRDFISDYKKLQVKQNNRIKNKLLLSLLETKFSETEAFCLINNIPVHLSQNQINHLKNNGVNLIRTNGKELPYGGFGSMSYDDDEESPKYEDLYCVFKFSSEELKTEVENLLLEEIYSNRQNKQKNNGG